MPLYFHAICQPGGAVSTSLASTFTAGTALILSTPVHEQPTHFYALFALVTGLITFCFGDALVTRARVQTVIAHALNEVAPAFPNTPCNPDAVAASLGTKS